MRPPGRTGWGRIGLLTMGHGTPHGARRVPSSTTARRMREQRGLPSPVTGLGRRHHPWPLPYEAWWGTGRTPC